MTTPDANGMQKRDAVTCLFLCLNLALLVLLVWWHIGSKLLGIDRHKFTIGAVLLVGLFFCMIGGLVLMGMLAYILRFGSQESGDLQRRGALFGSVLAFGNLPGYLVRGLLPSNDPFDVFRMCSLFIFSGILCGVWTGWLVWCKAHPEAPLLPQFSLRMLLLFVFMWGVMLAIFAPL